ncbi:MAG: hypothetical protein OES57_09295, partial [Acidimicrobiia bacterium]|nr:hypothetical protein [Acidimicrobiia bacterium]
QQPIDVVEAYRYVGQVLSAASELFIEADPDHPRMAPIVSPARKLQGDNPDAIYHYARIRGDRSYRVTGTIEGECYTSFTVHAAADDGGLAGAVLTDINHNDFAVGDDGSYSVVFGPTRHDGDWVEIPSEAYSIVVRSYYQQPVSAHNDPDTNVRIDIEPLGEVAPPPPLTDEVLAERMRAGVAFLRQATVGQGIPGQSVGVPFIADGPNELPKPFSFRDSGMPVPGAVDIHYAMGRWQLEPDEALLITGELPPCVFANVMLWNVHMQTLEYRSRQSSLNQAQIQLEDDGTYRIVVADRDPQLPNWLDTAGHPRGTIFWRFLLPERDLPQPQCEVVAVESLSG